MSAFSLTIYCGSPADTHHVGLRLGPAVSCGGVIALHGDLGAGKTLLVQGLAEGMGVLGRVASPTFIIMRAHPSGPGGCPLYHMDAYRLEEAEELWAMGFEEWLQSGVIAIEWAERVTEALPADRLDLTLRILDDGRELTLSAGGPQSARLLEHLRQCGY